MGWEGLFQEPKGRGGKHGGGGHGRRGRVQSPPMGTSSTRSPHGDLFCQITLALVLVRAGIREVETIAQLPGSGCPCESPASVSLCRYRESNARTTGSSLATAEISTVE